MVMIDEKHIKKGRCLTSDLVDFDTRLREYDGSYLAAKPELPIKKVSIPRAH